MPNTEGKFVFTENDCVVINPIVKYLVSCFVLYFCLPRLVYILMFIDKNFSFIYYAVYFISNSSCAILV